jgi:excisionase family DNA binding protein
MIRSTAAQQRQPAAGPPDRYLSLPEVADRLGTTERFARRLIDERRIEFHRFGRHIRVAESVLATFIESSVVKPIPRQRGRRVA